MHILFVVESPGKIKKIQQILDSTKDNYTVMATYGHIIDLNPKKLSLDENNNPIYSILSNKSKAIIDNIKKLSKKSDYVYIATDNDREGEMIGWSVKQYISTPYKRIIFNSITKESILNGIENPIEIDESLVESQKARRVIDRLVGYKLSPILWNNIGKNAPSAGRVQSVVVKLICDKEEEINKFITKSHFQITGDFICNKHALKGKMKNEINFDEIEKIFNKFKKAEFYISNIDISKSIKKSPQAFITSTLQQEATKIGFSGKKTMMICQKLYEKGYITYMRTDSHAISTEAKNKISKYIIENFDKSDVNLKNISAGTHEAIRPCDLKEIKLDGDEKRLYELIFNRTIASQMQNAIYKVYEYTIKNNLTSHEFVAEIEQIEYPGFLKIYGKISNICDINIKINDKVNYDTITGFESYKSPPSRYNEATLIGKIDKLNIGRPSTYTTIINKILAVKYVEIKDIPGIELKSQTTTLKQDKITKEDIMIKYGKETHRFVPTTLGLKVNKFLIDNFIDLINPTYTATLESDLDCISKNEKSRHEIIDNFYVTFEPQINNLLNKKYIREMGDGVVVRMGFYGAMVTGIQDGKTISVGIKEPYDHTTITLSECKNLLENKKKNKYPIDLGKYMKKKVVLNYGKYGFYIIYNKKNISVPKEVTLQEAIVAIQEPKKEFKYQKKK